jgi:glycerophosphoryl diester phosphodiesterase
MQTSPLTNQPPRPIVIAHRGACGYLPEHSFPAKAYAHAVGADYLEQDVVLTRDDVPVVFHDLILEEVTDVKTIYPSRRRADGHWYLIDFSYAELQELSLHDRIDPISGAPNWPQRFGEHLPLRIHSLAEELAFVRGLNRATGRHAGVYTEVKSPGWHRSEGKDLSPLVLGVLGDFGYRSASDDVWLQCFDAAELLRIRDSLGSRLRRVQLIGENDWQESTTDYDAIRSPQGLATVAGYADGIGPWIPQIATWRADHGAAHITPLVADAHAVGLAVHAYTLRTDQLPDHATGPDQVHAALFNVAKIDGLFSDFPDVTLRFLQNR